VAQRTFGLDFGTTNSLISYIDPEGSRALSLTDPSGRPHPSVVWYRGTDVKVGREARDHLDGGDEAISGDFVRSPKRLLAEDSAVHIAGRAVEPSDVVSEVLKQLAADAASPDRSRDTRHEVDRAVFTIPVDLDGAGRRRLRRAAQNAGISVVQFVHEPMAALYGYFRSQPDFQKKLSNLEGQRLLVFDWGGGTLDLTLCVVRGQRLIQIANRGDNDVGGDHFDEIIRNLVREKHAQQHGLIDVTSLEAEDVRVRLLIACEGAKIQLSASVKTPILVRGYLRDNPGRDLALEVTRDELQDSVMHLANQGLGQIDKLLADAGMTLQDVALCLPTGGMVQMPLIRDGLLQRFGARLKTITNGDRIIAEGAAWLAHDGAQLKLAKPIELLQPDQSYATLVSEEFTLPVEGQVIHVEHRMFYCVDPRDGVAEFEFARPKRVGYGSARAERLTYGRITVLVDPNARPLVERLEVHLAIDADYIVSVEVTSSGRRDRKSIEIYDLEFSLALPRDGETSIGQVDQDGTKSSHDSPQFGGVISRSNVTANPEGWTDVPGDVIGHYQPNWFETRGGRASDRQILERLYYQPCAKCRRSGFECEWDGCDIPLCTSPSTSEAVARRAPSRFHRA
jgi:molecular chaperone DnaK